MSSVAIFLGEGRAEVAGQSVPVVPVGKDLGLRILPDGPTLRPLTFGERASLARAATHARMPEKELAASVLAQASMTAGSHPAAAALALHLAGAGGAEIGFSAAQSLLARQLGWSPADLGAAAATEVDALAEDWRSSLHGEDSGWTKVVFKPEKLAEASTPDMLALALARTLLNRSQAGIDAGDFPIVPPSAPVSGVRRIVPDARSGPVAGGLPPVNYTNPNAGSQGTEEVYKKWFRRAAKTKASRVAPDNGSLAGTGPRSSEVQTARGPAAATRNDAPAGMLPDARLAKNSATPQILAGQGTQTGSPSISAPLPAEYTGGLQGTAHPLSAEDTRITPASVTAPPLASIDAKFDAFDPATATAQPFSGWFAPQDPGSARPVVERLQRTFWVWDRDDGAGATAPCVQQRHDKPSLQSTLDEVVDALNLAADLRGIAP